MVDVYIDVSSTSRGLAELEDLFCVTEGPLAEKEKAAGEVARLDLHVTSAEDDERGVNRALSKGVRRLRSVKKKLVPKTEACELRLHSPGCVALNPSTLKMLAAEGISLLIVEDADLPMG